MRSNENVYEVFFSVRVHVSMSACMRACVFMVCSCVSVGCKYYWCVSSSVRLFVRVRNVVCYLEIFGVRVKNLEIISHLEVTWRLHQKPGVSRQNVETWQACLPQPQLTHNPQPPLKLLLMRICYPSTRIKQIARQDSRWRRMGWSAGDHLVDTSNTRQLFLIW